MLAPACPLPHPVGRCSGCRCGTEHLSQVTITGPLASQIMCAERLCAPPPRTRDLAFSSYHPPPPVFPPVAAADDILFGQFVSLRSNVDGECGRGVRKRRTWRCAPLRGGAGARAPL